VIAFYRATGIFGVPMAILCKPVQIAVTTRLGTFDVDVPPAPWRPLGIPQNVGDYVTGLVLDFLNDGLKPTQFIEFAAFAAGANPNALVGMLVLPPNSSIGSRGVRDYPLELVVRSRDAGVAHLDIIFGITLVDFVDAIMR